MNAARHSCKIYSLHDFSNRIKSLLDAVNSKSTDGFNMFRVCKILLLIRIESRTVLIKFADEWQEAAAFDHCRESCAKVLEDAKNLKEQLVDAHTTLITLPSSVARWTARRLIPPILDWNDLVLDLSIAFDPEIQGSLSELEELL